MPAREPKGRDYFAGVRMLSRVLGVTRHSGGWPYLVLIVLAITGSNFAHFLDPQEPLFKGQPAGVIVAYVLTLLAVLAWIPYRPQARWSASFHWFAASLLASWGVAMLLALVHGDAFDLTALLPPVAVLLIWIKRPSFTSATIMGDAFAWALIAMAVAAQVMDWTGFHALHHEGWNRWPLLTDLTGPIGRWEGPFGNVNHAGPLGAFLLVYGVVRGGVLQRIVFVVAGGLIVLLSDSRGSLLAIAVGLVVALVVCRSVSGWRVAPWVKVVAVVGVVSAFVVYIVKVDPTFNGRSPVWAEFLRLWRASPVTGVGESGISGQIASGALPGWATHGHSLVLDPLGRVGLLGTIPIASAVIAALVIAWVSGRRGLVVSAAILATFLASGISEDLIDWRYAGVQFVPFLLAGLLGSTWIRRQANRKFR